MASTSQGEHPGIRGRTAGVNGRGDVRANRRAAAFLEAKFLSADADAMPWVPQDQRGDSHSVRRAFQQGAHSECLKEARTRASNAARGAIHISPGEPTFCRRHEIRGGGLLHRTPACAGQTSQITWQPAVPTGLPATSPTLSGASLNPSRQLAQSTHQLGIAWRTRGGLENSLAATLVRISLRDTSRVRAWNIECRA